MSLVSSAGTEPVAAAVTAAVAKVPFLREHAWRAGLSSDDVKTREDLARLPFTTKAHLRAHPPMHFWGVPAREISRVHVSSGSTGLPTLAAYTRDDLRRWAELTAADLARAGIGPGSVVVNAYPYGLSTGGLGFGAGAELLGATVIPASAAEPDEVLRILRVLSPDALLCTPNDATRLLEACEDAHFGPDDLPLKVAVLGGECWSEALRQRLEAGLGVEAFNVYGLSEVIGPGVASECRKHDGLHLAGTDFHAEVVDPWGDQPVAGDEPGELVLTTLRKQAMPLVRYRTGDLVTLTSSACPCGFDGPRIKVLGRHTERLGLVGREGPPVLPATIEDVLLRAPGVAPFYEIVAQPQKLTVRVETVLNGRGLVDFGAMEQALASLAGIDVAVELLARRSIVRRPGKARRVVWAEAGGRGQTER